MSHIHLALCDSLGVDGPLDEDAIELSRFISIAVDFAKHGKSVDPKLYKKIEDKVKTWPDFMEKKDKNKETR